MTSGVYDRKIKVVNILCHPNMKRHIGGICINCYSKKLKEINPLYKENQRKNSKRRYMKLGSKICNKYRTDNQRAWRIKAVLKLGGKCTKCEFDDIRALQIDHINGDGYKERTVRKSINRNISLGLIDLSRYQLLCANCNWIKRLENNEGTNRKDYNKYIVALIKKTKNE